MIYFDEAATTKPTKEAVAAFDLVATANWGNPSSTMYDHGMAAHTAVEDARKSIAKCIGAEPEQIFFTSGSTEGANWIIQGQIPRGKEYEWLIAYSAIEHPCVYNTVKYMGECGVLLGKLGVDAWGMVNVRDVVRECEYAYRKNKLFCIVGANNEIGTIQNIRTIANEIHKTEHAKLFCDMTQWFAHAWDVNVSRIGVDYAIASGQKFGAFKGCGFLYAKDPDSLRPFMYGGHQERGLRPGTENVGMIVAMADQFRRVCDSREADDQNLWVARNGFCRMLPGGAWVNGGTNILPNIMAITIPNVDANKLISFLNIDGFCLSAGSACSTGENKPSRIFKAIGMTDDDARSTIRVSFNTETAKHLPELAERINYHVEEGMCRLE